MQFTVAIGRGQETFVSCGGNAGLLTQELDDAVEKALGKSGLKLWYWHRRDPLRFKRRHSVQAYFVDIASKICQAT